MEDERLLEHLRNLVARTNDVEEKYKQSQEELRKSQAALQRAHDTLERYREVCRGFGQVRISDAPPVDRNRLKRPRLMETDEEKEEKEQEQEKEETPVDLLRVPDNLSEQSDVDVLRAYYELTFFDSRRSASASSSSAKFQALCEALLHLFSACPGGFVTEQQLIDHLGYHALTREPTMTSEELRTMLQQWPNSGEGKKIVARLNPEDSQWLFFIPEWFVSRSSHTSKKN
jgi:hypothetical protein